MLTLTTEIALKALSFMAARGESTPVTPQVIAEQVRCSSGYLAKTMGHLVKAGILKSQRGPRGGMSLAKKPAEITLLSVVQACQSTLFKPECLGTAARHTDLCGYHRAMNEVRDAAMGTLRNWTIADLASGPPCNERQAGIPPCRMDFLRGMVGAQRAAKRA